MLCFYSQEIGPERVNDLLKVTQQTSRRANANTWASFSLLCEFVVTGLQPLCRRRKLYLEHGVCGVYVGG